MNREMLRMVSSVQRRAYSTHGEFTPYMPVTAFIDIEGPMGAEIQNLLEITGIQQDLLDPVFGVVGSLGGMFTS
jgi:hypothetical protein